MQVKGRIRFSSILLIPLVLLAVLFNSGLLPQDDPAPEKGSEKKPAEKKAPEKKTGKEAKPVKKKDGDKGEEKADPEADAAFVRDGLKAFLNPTLIEELPEGRTKLSFFFFERDTVLEARFEPKVANTADSSFRWNRPNEPGGLHLSQNGMFHFNCWFNDDLEAEVEYTHLTNFSNRHSVALLFTNSSGQSLGNILGAQCATFSGSKLQKTSGGIEPLMANRGTKLKLVVAKGSFESHLGTEKKSSMRYAQKSFESGRLGFLWSGNLVAASISSLSITGRIDVARMANEMRKAGVKLSAPSKQDP